MYICTLEILRKCLVTRLKVKYILYVSVFVCVCVGRSFCRGGKTFGRFFSPVCGKLLLDQTFSHLSTRRDVTML